VPENAVFPMCRAGQNKLIAAETYYPAKRSMKVERPEAACPGYNLVGKVRLLGSFGAQRLQPGFTELSSGMRRYHAAKKTSSPSPLLPSEAFFAARHIFVNTLAMF
jgi:hypothetical protein